MAGVFINYRGADSYSYGALLYEGLVRRFGSDLVFLDAESIPAGQDYVEELLARVRSAGVLLAVIGRSWLTAADARAIDDPEDWVRRELVEAFCGGVRVIPVLTDDAELPSATALPADIAALSRCQARPLRRRETTKDLDRLAADLVAVNPELAAAAQAMAEGGRALQDGHGRSVRDLHSRVIAPLAPDELVGRATELAELAEFCTNPSTKGRYSWWRAEAWAGKTALFATFVMRPPSGVHLVSFFVTARLASQNDRNALVESLLEQLCFDLGVPVPQEASAVAREVHMLELLDKVARHHGDRGEQFALVVDGLDEDRGVDGTADAHSIAALLPTEPPHGMRVIVSGRPNPPVPFDVPGNHPLRDPGIVRSLHPSAAAAAQRADMERDLTRLLNDKTGRDLLGFLVAAGGGLTAADLASLTRTSIWEIQKVLHTVVGRSFAQRMDAVALAHQELQVVATKHLGTQLDGYRERLYAWAQGYAVAHWPPDTPEYLFRGYFTVLANVGNLGGMIACATDPHRHRRLRVRTGGYTAALAEISETQDRILASERPDFVTLARMAIHRTHLRRDASRIPITLPAGWARLGNLDRALAMIEALPYGPSRIDALLATEQVCRSMGQRREADELLDCLVEQVEGFDQFFGGGPVVSVVEAIARVGDLDRAAEVADCLTDLSERAEVFAFLACRAHEADDSTRSTRFLNSAYDFVHDESSSPARARGALAVAASKMGEPESVTTLLDEAEADLASSVIPERSAGHLARCAARVGQYDRALRLIALTDDEYRDQWFDAVIEIIAEQDVDSAKNIARTATDPTVLCASLTTIASTVARRAEHEPAARLITQAHDIARGLTDKDRRATALMSVAEVMVENGEPARAAELIREAVELGTNAEAVMSVARANFRTGDFDRGTELLMLAEDVARGSLNEYDERRSVQWIRTMADFRDFDRAERLASSFSDRTARAAAWATIAEGALAADELDRAERALSLVEDVALQRRPHLDLIGALLAVGDTCRAVELARGAATISDRVSALVLVAQTTRNDDLLAEAEQLIVEVDAGKDQINMMLVLIEATATMRLRDRVTSQLQRLQHLAQFALDTGQSAKTDPVNAFAGARMRTMVEIAERAAQLYGRSDLRFDPFAGVVPSASFPSKRNLLLAERLSAEDWTYAVEELVGQYPEAYPAILAELDAIADAVVPDGPSGYAFRW